MPLRNIVFDFGNVLLDLDIPKTEFAFSKIIQTNQLFDQVKMQLIGWIEQLEISAIDPPKFRKLVRSLALNPISDREIDRAFNAMLIRFPPHRFQHLINLKNQYRTFILSNTNSIHLDWVYHHLRSEHNIHDFEECYFEKCYYSHQIGLRKPGENIFAFIEKDSSLKPSETLFIDDMPENIQTAKNRGFNTILHDPVNDVFDVLRKEGIYFDTKT